MQSDFSLAILAAGPAVYYDGSLGAFGSLNDLSSNFNSASPVGSPVNSQLGADGASLTAVDIQGDSNPGNCYETSFDPFFSSPGEWTIGAWVYARSFPDGSGVIVDRGGFDNSQAYSLGTGSGSGGDSTTGGQLDSGSYNTAADGSLVTNDWVFLVCTFDYTNGFLLYQNATQVASQPTYGFPASEYGVIGFDDLSLGGNPYFPGLIDQPFIFSYALTDATITILDAAMRITSGTTDNINLTGISSAEALSALKLKDNLSLSPIFALVGNVSPLKLTDKLSIGGISSGESVSALKLQDKITLGGIASGEALSPVTLGVTDTLNLSGILTTETLSSLTLRDNISLGGIVSAESLSALKLTDQISLAGVATAENVPAIFQSAMRLQGISSQENVPALMLTEPGVSSPDIGRQTRGYGL